MLPRLSIKAKLFATDSFPYLVIATIGDLHSCRCVPLIWSPRTFMPRLPACAGGRDAGSVRTLSRGAARSPDRRGFGRADVDKTSRPARPTSKSRKGLRPLISSPAERELTDQLDAWQTFSRRQPMCSPWSTGRHRGRKGHQRPSSGPTGRAMVATLAKPWSSATRAPMLPDIAPSSLPRRHRPDGGYSRRRDRVWPRAAIYMVRDIRRGIGSILKPMGQLTDGELAVDIPHRG